MKKVISVISILVLMATPNIKAQSSMDIFGAISETFINNDYQKLSSYFAKTLDMTIESNDGTYGKQQATILIKEFFKKNRTSSFSIKHKGASNAQTHYAVCDLQSNNKKWNVYILLDKQSKIIQLQIEN